MIRRLTKSLRFAYAVTVKTCLTEGRQAVLENTWNSRGGSDRTWKQKNSGSLSPGYEKRKK